MTAVVTRIPALTVLNPWAAAIAHLGKAVENRVWAPPQGLVGGQFYIHAGKGWDREGLTTLRRVYGVDDALRHVVPSAIVAAATLDGYCTPQFCSGSCSRWAIPGQYHWLLTDVVTFTDPVGGVTGRQGIWYPAGDVAETAAVTLARSTPHTTPISCTGRRSVDQGPCGTRLEPRSGETWSAFETRARVQGWRISPDGVHAMCPRCGGAPSAATPVGGD